MVTVRISLLLLSWLLILSYSCVQPPMGSTVLNNAPYTLVGDTLFNTENFKIYPEQKFKCGKGSDENGWYKAITFKNPANWANLLWREMEIKNNIDYQFDEGKRDKDKVKEYLNPGDTLVVTKIEKRGNRKYGYWYVVNMRQGQGPLSLQYTCTIAEALKSDEILLVSE
jgi:hypothetical protein